MKTLCGSSFLNVNTFYVLYENKLNVLGYGLPVRTKRDMLGLWETVIDIFFFLTIFGLTD